MSQASRHSRRAQLGQRSFAARYAAGTVATCLVLLQLVTALHFALIPHGFSASLNGFVHVHEAAVNPVRAVQRGTPSAALVSGTASCEPESCPFGFAGTHTVLFASPASSALLESGVAQQAAPAAPLALTRSRVLLSAPKTSPPSV